MEAKVSRIRFINKSVDSHKFNDALEIIQIIKPLWREEDIVAEDFKCGFVNSMVCYHLREDEMRNDALIVRIFRDSLGEVSSRDREFLSMQLAGSAGCFPPVFACFNNGVVYKFAKGRGVTYHDVVKPDFIRELTSKLHALHNVDLESARVFNRNGESTTFGCNPDPFGRMAAFIRKIPQSLKNPERDSQLKRYRTVLTNEVLWGELKYLKSLLAKSNLPLSFVHNDFHPGNIVIDDTTGTVTIVDYEFVSFGYEYTDLSALLLQRNCIVAAKLVPPDVPEITDETRQMYIIAYENAKCNNEFDSIDDERMDVLQKQYRLADLANLGFYMASYMAISDVEGLDVFLDAVEGIRAKYYDLKKLLAEQDHEKE